MAEVEGPDTLPQMIIILVDGPGVPFSFPVGGDGFGVISAFRLSLRFHYLVDSMHIDEEFIDAATGQLTHTVAQISTVSEEGKIWLLKPGRYRLYGLNESLHSTSSELLTSRISSTCMHSTPILERVKVERGLETIQP